MSAIVASVKLNSIAEDLEIKAGDEIISIDEIKPADLLDYKYLISSEEISIHIKRANGDEEIIDIEKDSDEDLGIIFESAVFDKVIPCNNKCIFCFVDQQPDGLRDSLYVKDDDYRLSYLQGTYITLTNLNQKHRDRIETLRPGPLFISVHSTNPEVRSFMLKNPKAKNILAELKWLNSLDIPVHIQIVLCPGINDGDELDRTLNDLFELKSNILSIAVVPVGITKYRQDNNLVKVDSAKAREVISQVSEFNRKVGCEIAFPSDEFYVLTGDDFPDKKFYGDFGQLDDGVGASRLLMQSFEKFRAKLPSKLNQPKIITIATGQIACNALNPIINELNKISNLKINLVPVKSKFWGENITVSGLITGQDLLDNLMPVKSEIGELVIPSVMLRQFTHDFLDGKTLEEIKNDLDCNIHLITNYYSVEELIGLIVK